jgi:hypothetical protein
MGSDRMGSDFDVSTLLRARCDIFWLRYESLEESDNLPDPEVLAQEIVEDLESSLEF